MFDGLTTRQKGDIGLTAAIYYLTLLGYTVSIPITDNQYYDLIIEKEKKISTVQVKTTSEKENGKFKVELKRVRPNRTETKIYVFNKECDFLGVFTENKDFYLIPCEDINNKYSLHINHRFDKFKLS